MPNKFLNIKLIYKLKFLVSIEKFKHPQASHLLPPSSSLLPPHVIIHILIHYGHMDASSSGMQQITSTTHTYH